MALSTQDIVIAKDRLFNVFNAISPKDPSANMLASALFQFLGQHKGNPNLECKVVKLANAADSVIADAACKVYGIFYAKPAASSTAAFLVASDHASAVQAEEEFRIDIPAADNKLQALIFPHGKAFGTGVTMASYTTAAGGTRSADADSGTLTVLLGAA